MSLLATYSIHLMVSICFLHCVKLLKPIFILIKSVLTHGPFYSAHVYTAMTRLQLGGIKNKIRGELILNSPEKFKLGRVSSISWLIT